MNYQSFYGGREGRTYHLVARYDSIYQMVVECFQKGGAYTDANYNEYVIIDTKNKGSRENGIIYRRGLNYQESFALEDRRTITKGDKALITLYGEPGIVYRTDGTGVNVPESGSLSIEFEVPKYYEYSYVLTQDVNDGHVIIDLHETSEKRDEDGELVFEQEFLNFCMAPGGGAEYIGRIVGPAGQSPIVRVQDWETFETTYHNATNGAKDEGEVVRRPGKINDTQYEDSIKYGYCNFIDEETGENLGVYLSFDLPLTIFEYTAESVSPYGPTIREVDELPQEGEEEVYYHYNDKYYLWDATAQEVDQLSSTTDTTIYKTVPKFVEAEPWQTIHTAGSTKWEYTNLIREKEQSRPHDFYKSYDIKVPVGVHGQDIEVMSTHITDANGNMIDPYTNALETVDRDDYGNIRHYDELGNPTNNFSVFYKTRNYNDSQEGELSDEQHIGWFRVVDRITNNENERPYIAPIERETEYAVNDRAAAADFGLNDDYCLLCIAGGETAADPIDCTDFAIGWEFYDGTVKWRVVERASLPADLLTVHYTYGADDNVVVRMLDQITVSDDGGMYAKYTDIDHSLYLGELRSVKEVFFDNSQGIQSFIIRYSTKLRHPDGTVIINDDRSGITYDQSGLAIRDADGYVIGYPLTDSEGYILEQIPQHIKFITSMVQDPNTQYIKVYYNDGTKTSFGPYYTLTGVCLNENLEIEFTWNYKDKATDTEYHKSTLNDILTNTPHKFKTVNEVWVENEDDIDKDQYIKVNYFVGTNQSDGTPSDDGLGDESRVTKTPLNKVQAVRLHGDNLCFLYSSKEVRDAIQAGSPSSYYMLDYTNPKTGETKKYCWHNLGPIQDSNHILGVFANLEELKNQYPYGLGKTATGEDDPSTVNRAGWIALIKHLDQNGKEQTDSYIYDYVGLAEGIYEEPADAWVLGDSFNQSDMKPNFIMVICDADIPDYTDAAAAPVRTETNNPDKLNENGYWFVSVEEESEYI